jgi:hypothetical protein
VSVSLDPPQRRASDPVARVVQFALPTWAWLMSRSWNEGRLWWLWFWTKVVPDVFWFFVFLFVDRRGEGLSLTRFMAIAFAALDCHIIERAHVVSANALWLALACFAVAFGKSTFEFLLRRGQQDNSGPAIDRDDKEVEPVRKEGMLEKAIDKVEELKG